MFVTKRKLKEENSALRRKIHELEHHERRSALVEKANLPKCKSVACYNCEHCTFLYNPSNGALYLLGCGLGLSCNEFVYTDANKPPLWEGANAILRDEGLPQECEKGYLPDAVSSAPRPPCHVV